jgi:hypothetical protein
MRRAIAFFATTTNLVEEWTAVLGADLAKMDRSYDFVAALLASSAFPIAFPPKRASEIYPGIGQRDLFFADGGTFDNLPFVPALSVLGGLQVNHGKKTRHENWLEHVQRRTEAPDLFLVGALDARQEPDPEVRYDTLDQISKRAARLEQNEKIYGFQEASRMVHRQMERLAKVIGKAENPDSLASLESRLEPHREFLERVVDHAVMAVYPADNTKHLNGTFQFCRSVGLKKERLERSIAHGCFQTLLEFAKPSPNVGSAALHKSLRALKRDGRIPSIQVAAKNGGVTGLCPYFLSTAQPEDKEQFGGQHKNENQMAPMVCPFYRAKPLAGCAQDANHAQDIYEACIKDQRHNQDIEDLRPKKVS